jgi:DNA-binding response OmpR family regulator
MAFRALLVTKDELAAEVLAPVLSHYALAVERCGYSEAVCLVTEQRFQAVVVDFDDPHSASLVLDNAFNSPASHPVTIALLSHKERVRSAFGAGANFVLYKPLSTEQAEATLRAATALIKNERRNSYRVPIQVAVRLRVATADRPIEIEGILLDLSDTGMDVLASQALCPGSSMHARFTLPNSPTEFEVLAEVAWANPNGESGVRFTATPENVRAALRLWLRENSQAAAAAEPEPVADCKLTDLSLGGCYIETAAPFPERTHVVLILRVDGAEMRTTGLVRVMHPSRGMGIEFAAGSSGQRTQTEKFIQFLTSRPGIDPQLSVTPHNAENPHEAYDQQNDDVDDPLLDLLRNHESFSEEMFVEALRSQRGAEFVRD